MVNSLLRSQRQLRGWSLQHVVDQVCKLCEDEERIPGLTADMVGKWERGEKKPSPYYQTKLCELYQTSADRLGFVLPLDGETEGGVLGSWVGCARSHRFVSGPLVAAMVVSQVRLLAAVER